MTTFNLNFDNAANYTLSDSNAITVANSTATLKGAGTPLGADSFTSGGKSAMWNYYNGVSFTEDSTYGIYTISASNYTYGYESVASVTDFELGIGGYTNRGQLQIVLYQDANNNLYIYKNFNGSNNWNVYYGGKIGGVTVGPSWTQEINNNTCDIKLKRVGSTVTAYNRGTLVATYTFNSNPGKIQIINSCQGPYTTSYINSFNFVSATSILNYPTSSNYTIQTTNTNHFTATTANKIDSITIPTSIPANTSIKSLVSFDGRATWKYWNVNQWSTSPIVKDSYTKLLCHFNSDLSDSATSKTVSIGGGSPTITNAQSKFGGSSVYFNGTSYLSLSGTDTDLVFGTGDFTIDTWVRFTQIGINHQIYSRVWSGTNYFLFSVYNDNRVSFCYATSGGGTTIYGPSTQVVANQWHHIAVVRSNNVVTCYLDGVGGTPSSCSQNFSDATHTPLIGMYYPGANTYYLNGYLDEFRISKGVARWTTSFTPPTQAYTLNDIESVGMTPTALNSALTGYVFQAGDTSVDLAFSLKTTDTTVSPTISGITINYSPFNNPPIAPSISDVTKYNLNTVIQLPAFTDPDGNTLTYSVSGLPSGMTFNPTTRQIRGIATTTGQHSITMTANDGAGGVTNQGFLLTLNKVPTNTKIEDCFE